MKVARGVVLGVERNIMKSFCARDGSGQNVYFVLVRYPDKLISELRRLSKGAKVISSAKSMRDGYVRLKISEVNGVAVTLSSVDVKVRKRNRFAKAITLFLWHVPSESEQNYLFYFDPVKLRGSSRQVELSLEKIRKNFADYLLGAEFEKTAVLKGHDEIVRPINLRVSF